MTAAELLAAIDAAIAGRWEDAHRMVQQDETDPKAAWIHAVLHKSEGDLENARYWYRRAGRTADVSRDPQDELRAIRASIV